MGSFFGIFLMIYHGFFKSLGHPLYVSFVKAAYTITKKGGSIFMFGYGYPYGGYGYGYDGGNWFWIIIIVLIIFFILFWGNGNRCCGNQHQGCCR